jgi:hypothetical protein
VSTANEAGLASVASLAGAYAQAVADEGATAVGADRDVARVGRADARSRLDGAAAGLMEGNVLQACAAVVATLAF